MSKRSFTAHPVCESDLEAYSRSAREYGSVFDTLAWTDLFGGSLSRYGIYDAGGDLRGGFCMFSERRMGLAVLRNPPFTPSIGPFFERRAQHSVARLEERRAVLDAMAGLLESLRPPVVSLSLSQGIPDVLPFYWRNYKVVPRYTYTIDLSSPTFNLEEMICSEYRNHARKAQRDGLTTQLLRDYTVVRDLVLDTFSRQRKDPKLLYLEQMLGSRELNACSYSFATYRDGIPIACVWAIHDTSTAFNLLSGYSSARSHSGAGILSMLEAIRYARSLGLKTFDFEGSVVPAIERYFRGFGGKLTPYFRVNKAWLPLEMALKPFKRRLF